MTALWITAAAVGFLLLLLLLPVSVHLRLDEQFSLRVRYAGIPVYSYPGKPGREKKKKKEKKSAKLGEAPAAKENYFQKLRRERGWTGAVRQLCRIAGLLLRKLRWFVRRLKFRAFRFRLVVATADAAETAVDYGIVCSAVYPVLTGLFTLTDCKAKQIDISADFDHTNPQLEFSFSVGTRLLTALIAVLSGFRELKKIKDVELHE